MSPRWRFACPRGHVNWEPKQPDHYRSAADGQYLCRTCREHGDDPYFDRLVDKKTGERVSSVAEVSNAGAD